MTSNVVLLLQGGALLWFLVRTSVRVLLSLPVALVHSLCGSLTGDGQQKSSTCMTGCVFYEGTVSHVRARPVYNAFQCAPALLLGCMSLSPHPSDVTSMSTGTPSGWR